MAGRGRGMTLPAWMQAEGAPAPGGLAAAPAVAAAAAPMGGPGGLAAAAPPSFGAAIPPPTHFGVPSALPGGSGAPHMHAPMPVAATKFGIDRERKFTGRKRRRKTLFDVPPGAVEEVLGKGDLAAGGVTETSASGGASMQASRHARRIYVGGIGEVSERDLQDFFNSVIDQAYKPVDGGAVLSVFINNVRRFAFVEFRSLELTSAAMQLDGINYNGQPLKLRRPNDFNPDAVPAAQQGTEIRLNLGQLGIVSSSVPDGPNKIFVGGIPHHLSGEEIMQLLTPFGPLKGFHLVKEAGAMDSKGYAFVEFADPSISAAVCEGLHGLQLLDRPLTVRMAMNQSYGGGPMPGAEPQPTGANAMPTGVPAAAAVAAPAAPAVPAAAPPAAPAAAPPASVHPTRPPTSILRLSNMVTVAELEDDAEYADIKLDIAGEAGKFGSVAAVDIPRRGAPGTGHVFIKFADAAGAAAAAANLAGRTFADRTVAGEYIAEDAYAAGNLE